MFKRLVEKQIQKRINSGKAIIISGPRQTGKSTLIQKIVRETGDYISFDGDDPDVRNLLNQPNTEELRQIIDAKSCIVIDEAQRIPHIGVTLKILTDQIKPKHILVSGSSSFEINQQVNEPLTGRKWEYKLFPVSWQEWKEHVGPLRAKQQLEQRMIFGMYPEVLNHQGDEVEILQQLTSSYLYKDILALSNLRRPDVLDKLLQALAYQIGQEVSLNELSSLLRVDKNTVQRYIWLLEQAYVVFQLPSFSRNLRNEIKRNQKIYFYDTGIRNMVIRNMNPLEFRPDKGALWENFLIAERMKHHEYQRIFSNRFFWRNTQKQEIDYVEERDGKIFGFEFKWNPSKKVRWPKSFVEKYEPETKVIHPSNFEEFVC